MFVFNPVLQLRRDVVCGTRSIDADSDVDRGVTVYAELQPATLLVHNAVDLDAPRMADRSK